MTLFSVLAVVAPLLSATPADEPTSGRYIKPLGELATARVRYAWSYRAGSQIDLGPPLAYGGWGANDLALGLSYFGPGWLGVGLSLEREAFALGTPGNT